MVREVEYEYVICVRGMTLGFPTIKDALTYLEKNWERKGFCYASIRLCGFVKREDNPKNKGY